MRLAIDLEQLRRIHVRVPLRGAEARVAEQLLNRAQVGAALQQVGRERVTQRMRADARTGTACSDIAPNKAIDTAGRQTSAPIVDKQRLAAVGPAGTPPNLPFPSSYERGTIVEVAANRLRRAAVERDDAFLTPFAEHTHHPRAQVHMVHVEAGELAETQS